MLALLPGTQVGMVLLTLIKLKTSACVTGNTELILQPLASETCTVYVAATKLVNNPLVLVMAPGFAV